MSFKHLLGQVVKVSISGEEGHVKGRAEYSAYPNSYYVHYLAADGKATERWFDENEIQAVVIGE
ncbi:hypothetical protein C5E22_11675 [Pectobacterium parmentieri]|uniref:hypothetical protein n=1 Tax=Pectobacterium TaxID=122277 RepID=UPI000EB4D502|nr:MULTISPECIES: hypothetical protein [Pectobacterium]AYH10193.1 hypothetical protein C5E24_11115 [Pectobacterium parmentieri]AYH19096.1 hypothetical protein C5E22_11675 [Pectobacterium parmentieri]AZS56618.1 hypothetical protein C5E18_11060 [Pectobacterium parmentieri]MBQ4779061.1 hypothetical protein [Pectobacterium versatile]MBQ4783461.1 hypothetical protein [Pectobacterium versatile]